MLSVVLTAYNEEPNLTELYTRLTAVLCALGQEYEILIVDDGSTDGTAALLKEICAGDNRVRGLRLSRNFGQHAAVAAGFAHCSGEAVIWMDADLQDVPEEIPNLLAGHQAGYDVVYAVREHRQDPLLRRLNARAFFWLFGKVSGHKLPEGVSTFRVLSRPVVDALNRMPEHSRFTAGMIAWLGFRFTTVPVRHAARGKGRSTYTPWRLLRLSLDAVFSFSDYPMKLASNAGCLLSLASLLVAAFMVYRKLTSDFVITGYASLIVAITFLAGVQFFFTGIIGEYIARIFVDVQRRPLYVVQRKLNL